MQCLRMLRSALLLCLFLPVLARAQSPWQPLTNQPPIGAGVILLLTDGRVLCQDAGYNDWWLLTPDASGSYVNGTWTQAASLPSNYGPLYFASAVLADGRVVVIGGEYNFGNAVWTNQGAIYDPTTDAWSNLPAPSGWNNIGDAQCCVLPDGRFFLGDPFNTNSALLDPATLIWTAGGGGKTDRNDEEGWTLLPDGTVLTVDALNAPNAEKYVPWLNTWINAGTTPVRLEDPGSQELGPAVLMPNGTVFATGATGHNALYTPPANPTDPGAWTAAPDFPLDGNGNQLDIADGPACLLPNGNVLCGASPGVFNAPTSFFEFDGTNLNPVPATPRSIFNPSYVGNMLILPTGQVMYTDTSADVEIYTPSGSPNPAWAPAVTNCPPAVTPGQSYVLQGTQFNGLSQASAYGDDSTNATNYPLVRITNIATGHVVYCRTFNHSTMAVATGAAPVSTNFTVPATIELGPSVLEVVTNGIPSAPCALTVDVTPVLNSLSPATTTAGGPDLPLTVNGSSFDNAAVVNWNGTALATTFVSTGQLTATVPAALIATAGTADVTVVNPGSLTSNALTFSIDNPGPVLSSLSPASTAAGSSDFTLTVNGSGFISGSTVNWTANSTTTPLTTTFVSATQLTATVPAALVTTAGTASVTVVTPAPGGGTSGSQTFTINSPAITTLSPSTATVGGPAFTLTVNGSSFLNGSTVNWNGSALATTFVSASQLTASVPAADIAAVGTASITVTNPGGAASNTVSFSINNPTPVLNSITPKSTNAGGPTFKLTVNGSNFIASSKVNWNGAALTTTFVSATQLKGTVPAALIASAGTASIAVVTPSGGTSASQTFTILQTTLKVVSATLSRDSTTGAYTAVVSIKNAGRLTAANTNVTSSTLGRAATSTPLPANVGDIPAGSTGTVTLVYPASAGTPGASVTLKVSGTFTNGTFTGSLHVTLPH